MDFDLPDFDTRSGAGFELQLLDPKTNRPTERYLTVHGVDSDAYRAASMEQERRWLKSKVNRRTAARLSPEELESETITTLAACTSDWRGITDKKGEAVPFSRAAAIELYRQFPAIREQVAEAMGDRANFLPNSSTS